MKKVKFLEIFGNFGEKVVKGTAKATAKAARSDVFKVEI